METTTQKIKHTQDIRQWTDVTRVFDFLAYQENTNPQKTCIAAKKNGQWQHFSTQEVRKQSDLVSLGLLQLDIKKGDSVAIISENRPEWNFADLGAMQIGAVVVPLYPTASVSDFEYILQHAETKVVFVSKKEFYDKVHSVAKNLPHLKKIYTFDPSEGAELWTDLTQAVANQDSSIIESYRQNVMPEDLMTLMYTSGTTGQPKGVMITHDNLVFNIFTTRELDLGQLGNENEEKRALSFLPLCHVYEKSVFYSYLFLGINMYYAESMETIAANLQEVKPHTFTTVPRLLEKVYEKIEAKGNELTGPTKIIFRWAMRLAERYDPEGNNGGWYGFQLKWARKLVFSKWQAALGGNVRAAISGAAALSPRLARLFWAANIPILEGYGQSESTPVFSVNTLDEGGHLVGTVGRMNPGVEGAIVPEEGYRPGEGEIVCRGRNVMRGYFKNPEQTAETIKNGWLHTGDIGMFVDAKGNPIVLKEGQTVTRKDPYFLKITDRKKEVFKTSGGKYIAPLPIETKFKESILIEQMMVVGEYKKFPAALVVPSFDNLKVWCADHDVPFNSREEVVKDPRVVAKYQRIVDEMNEFFGQVEKIKKFKLLTKEWTIESNELTPTMKMKRRVITANYKQEIEDFYTEG
ncbi:MAG: long-chain fatty acid--CoA ligase [Cytophagales bacterium]|nr:MAG: long-chain fatty acid--CoA ligase [Cytophagales bacterium]